MYGQNEKQESAKHVELAGKIAAEICNNFQPFEQNEIISHIVALTREERIRRVENAEKEFNSLINSLKELEVRIQC